MSRHWCSHSVSEIFLPPLLRRPIRLGALLPAHVYARFHDQRHEEHVEEVCPVQPRREPDGCIRGQRLRAVVAGDEVGSRVRAQEPPHPQHTQQKEGSRSNAPKEPMLTDALFTLRLRLTRSRWLTLRLACRLRRGFWLAGRLSPDVCIGTHSVHSPAILVDTAAHIFTDAGFRVERNTPFTGVYIPVEYEMNPAVLGIMFEVRDNLLAPGSEAAGRMADALANVIEEAERIAGLEMGRPQ